MIGPADVTRIADGVYRVLVDGRMETIYVAGPPDDRWVWWNGQAFRFSSNAPAAASPARAHAEGHQSLTAPMPARVARIVVTVGARVRKGDTLLVLEAMKMELPLRAPEDGTVAAVLCQEGQLVQPETVLVEFQ